jgi:signal transduction histidine kinase
MKDIFIWFAGGAFWMLIAIILLVWVFWKRSRRNLYIIGLQNKHLDAALESLEQRNREYDHMVKVLAHDLRNPIGGISGMTSMLGEDEAIASEGQKLLGLIGHSCDKLLGLINDLLENSSGTESRKMSLNFVSMQDLLHDCVSLLQFRAREKKQDIRLGRIPDVHILMDENKMWRVFNNLIVNAVKFSPERSVIRVFAERKGHRLVIGIADSGIGIPEEMQEKVFDVYTEAKRTGTGGEKPFGLGLSISRQIVEAHGGSLWLESKVGIGTTFYVSLPALEVTEESGADHLIEEEG